MAEKTIKFPKKIVDHYIETLKQKIEITDVLLFGSFAWGQPTKHSDVDLVVIGAGPAGLAAAVSAKKNGVQNLVLVERNGWLGGILPQCIHDGFGLELFKEQLTGPEYAQRYIDELNELGILCMLN